jgi:hypothetical protein
MEQSIGERHGLAHGKSFDEGELRSPIGTAIAQAHVSIVSKVAAKLII